MITNPTAAWDKNKQKTETGYKSASGKIISTNMTGLVNLMYLELKCVTRIGIRLGHNLFFYFY